MEEEDKPLTHYQKYRDTIMRCSRNWYSKPENKEKIKEWNRQNSKKYYKLHREQMKMIPKNDAETQTDL